MFNIHRITKEIVDLQKKHRLIFFVGAGISTCPSLPLAGELQSEIISVLFRRYRELFSCFREDWKVTKNDSIEKLQKLRLEQVLEALFENCKHAKELLNIFKVGSPNEYHHFLSESAKLYGPLIIVTTNFDTLIEQAMDKNKVRYETIFEEIGFLHLCKKLQSRPLNCTLILKLHGTVDEPDSIRATLKNVGDRYISLALRELFAVLFHRFSFLILGYSACDDFDINQALCNLTSHNKIYFISHDIKIYKVAPLSYPFKNFEGYKIYCDTELIMQNLASNFMMKIAKKRLPKAKKDGDWKISTEEWYAKLDNLEASSTIGRLLYEVHDLKGAEIFFKKALEIASLRNNPDEIIRMLNNLGSICYQSCDYDKAKQYYFRALTLAKMTKIIFSDYPIVLTNLSQILLAEGNLPASMEFAMKSIKAIGKTKREKIHKISAYKNIANLFFRSGDYKSAIKYCRKALELAAEYGDIKTVSQIYCTLGNIFYLIGDKRNSYKFYAKDLIISEKLYKHLQNHLGLCDVYLNFGAILIELGNFKDAQKYLERGLNIAQNISNTEKQAQAINNIGLLQYRQKHYLNAKKYFLSSLKFYQKTPDKKGVLSALRNLGGVAIELNKFSEAKERFNRAWKIAIKLGEKYEIAEIKGGLGLVLLKIDKFDDSEKYLLQALKLYEEMGNVNRIASTLNNLGVVYNFQHKWRDAIESNKRCLDIKSKIGDKEGSALALTKLGHLYIEIKKYEEALDLFKRALPFYETKEKRDELLNIYKAMSEIYKQIGNNKKYSFFKRKSAYSI